MNRSDEGEDGVIARGNELYFGLRPNYDGCVPARQTHNCEFCEQVATARRHPHERRSDEPDRFVRRYIAHRRRTNTDWVIVETVAMPQLVDPLSPGKYSYVYHNIF